jgi:hypothetical protein
MDELYGMKKVEMTDHEFGKYLRNKDPKWTWDSLSEFNRFMAHGEMVALVKYHNKYPVGREIWIKDEPKETKVYDLTPNRAEKLRKVDIVYGIAIQCDMINGTLYHMSKEYIDDEWVLGDMDDIIKLAKQCIKDNWKKELKRRFEVFVSWDNDDLDTIIQDCLSAEGKEHTEGNYIEKKMELSESSYLSDILRERKKVVIENGCPKCEEELKEQADGIKCNSCGYVFCI